MKPFEAYTNFCKLGIAGTEKMVWGPDPLYVVNIDDLDIQNSEETLILKLKPKLVIRTYSFSIKVQGLSNVSNVIGSIGGMADHYFLGKAYAMCDDYPINIDLECESREDRRGIYHFWITGSYYYPFRNKTSGDDEPDDY